MFWIFVSVVATATIFTQFGAVTAVSKMLSIALKLAMFVIAGLLLALFGSGKKGQSSH